MFTMESLRQYPGAVKAFTGLPAEEFWRLVDAVSARWAEEEVADGRVLIDATEQRVARPGDDATQRRYYSGKKKRHTLKTQLVTDGDHHVHAISTAVPGAIHDKPLCDGLRTLDRLPDGV